MNLPVGTIVSGRYEILEKIGAGGMAIVYRAKDIKLERFVTFKVLREEFASDEEFKARFQVEARAAASLSHPNIVNVYDVGEDGDVYYIVMEYVHGETLKKAIQEKAPFDTLTTLGVAIQMASALSHAHRNHIVHRDIKPQNILVAVDGTIKVTDFGIARAVSSKTVTISANALGSVHYFSPEQARGGYVDEKSDIYSLGITMFEMITGKVPYDGDTSVAIALKHINDELPDIRQYNPNVSKSLEGIIKKATRKKSDERYQNIDLLLADLKKSLSDSSGEFIARTRTAGSRENQAKEAVPKVEATPAAYVPRRKASETEEETAALYTPRRRRESADKTDAEKPYIPESRTRRSYSGEGIKKEPDNDEVKVEISSGRPRREVPSEFELPESNVGFDKYQKKLKTKDDRRRRRTERIAEEEYEEETDFDKKQERKVVIAAVITALLIICIISFAGLKFINRDKEKEGNKTEQSGVTVPDLTGLTLAQAQNKAADYGFKVAKTGEEYSRDYSEGLIISQTVQEGEDVSKIDKNESVGVVVSKGLESFDMPDVKGKEESEAKKAITDIVSCDVEIQYEFDEEAELGKVISQQPSSGTKINKDSKVILTVCKGEELKKIKVPQVEGKTEAAARKELEDLGLVVGNVTQMESAKVEKGHVITQTIPAGDEVIKGNVVGLVVSSGPKEEENTVPKEDNNQNTDNNNQGGNDGQASGNTGSGSRSFQVVTPVLPDASDTVHVKIIQIGEGGTEKTILDTDKNMSDFPFNVTASGTGQAEIRCYINDVYQWSESVNFSEGGN